MKIQDKTNIDKKISHVEGQTLIEYALIVVLGSIVVIVALGLLGMDLSILYTAIRNAFPT